MFLQTPLNKTVTNNVFDSSPLHNHAFWEVVFFIDGDCKHNIMGKTYKPVNSDVFIVGPSHSHNIEIISKSHCHRDLYFSVEQVKKTCSLINVENFYQHLCDNIIHFRLPHATFNMIINQLEIIEVYDSLAQTSPLVENIKNLDICISVSNSILSFLLGTYALNHLELSQAQPKWVMNLLSNLNSPSFFSQKPNEIVKNSGYSHSRFSELFKQHVGMPLVDYMIKKRMSYAADLLLTTDKSTLEISSIVGYDSYSCFVKLFKKFFNISPKQYRKHHITQNDVV